MGAQQRLEHSDYCRLYTCRQSHNSASNQRHQVGAFILSCRRLSPDSIRSHFTCIRTDIDFTSSTGVSGNRRLANAIQYILVFCPKTVGCLRR
jgi:hypothetical protein